MTGANTTPLSFDRREQGGGNQGGGASSLLNPSYLSGNSEGGNGNFGARQFEGAPPGSGPPNRMMDGFDHPPPSHRGEHRGGGGRGRGRGDGGRGRGGGYTPSEGDWPCPDPSCGNVNFARRTSCNRCGVDKPMDKRGPKGGIKIGSNAAEKSKGLFSADDWQCGKCGNVNWARRSTCNVCNGPQFTVEEERTGLGGGFDERGTVEYKTPPRESSDDEFDDLGRRKKKYKMPYKKPMIAQSVPDPPSEPEEEDEEEEDDDDDDGDLSKYDLWGDPDEDKKDGKEDSKPSNGNKAKEESSKVSEEKRTRSRSKDTSKKRSRRSRSSRFTMIGFYSVLFLSCRLFKLFEQLQLIAVSVSIEKEAKVRKKALKKLFKLIFKSVQVDFRNKSLKPP